MYTNSHISQLHAKQRVDELQREGARSAQPASQGKPVTERKRRLRRRRPATQLRVVKGAGR